MALARIAIIHSKGDASYTQELRTLLEMRAYECDTNHMETSNLETTLQTKIERYDHLLSERVLASVVLVSYDFLEDMRKDRVMRDALIDALHDERRKILLCILDNEITLPKHFSRYFSLPVPRDDATFLADAISEKFKGIEAPLGSDKKAMDIKLLLALASPSAQIKPVAEWHRDWRNHVYYQIYAFEERIFSDLRYFIHLTHDANLLKTFQHIQLNHPAILKHGKVLILADAKRDTISFEKRRQSIERVFGKSTLFVAEFYHRYCAPHFGSTADDAAFPINDYIEAYVSDFDGTALQYLRKWWFLEDSPALMVIGSGGIGKTTLIQKFINEQSSGNNGRLIYLEAADILSYMHSHIAEYESISDIYALYHAYVRKNGGEPLTRGSFDVAMATGAIAIIIDGFDEVLANLSNLVDFDVFMNSIYKTDFGKTKVLITCRDNLIQTRYPYIKYVDLLPFDNNAAISFFERRLRHMPQKTKKAMALADELHGESHEARRYIPFILDIVATMVEENPEDNTISDFFFSKLLDHRIKFDRMCYAVCVRETTKYSNNISVDHQVRFLSKLAVTHRGHIHPSLLSELVQDALGDNLGHSLSLEVAEQRLRSHPFVGVKTDIISFRYNALAEQFASLGAVLCIVGFLPKADQLAILLASNAKINSNFLIDAADRLNARSSEEDIHLALLELLESLPSNRLLTHQKQEDAIAGIASLILQINLASGRLNSEHNMQSIRNVFWDSHTRSIKGLVIRDLGRGRIDRKITFNFRGTRFFECKFKAYDWFWECHFDEDTRFEECELIELPNSVRNSSAKAMNFGPTCKADASVSAVINYGHQKEQTYAQSAHRDLAAFFKLFFERGMLTSREERNIYAFYRGDIDPSSIKEHAKKNGFHIGQEYCS